MGSHCHRSSSVRIRLQSQDDDSSGSTSINDFHGAKAALGMAEEDCTACEVKKGVVDVKVGPNEVAVSNVDLKSGDGGDAPGIV